MTTVNPYLLFNGNCEEAFNFYKSIFKKEFVMLSRYEDIPPDVANPPIPEDKKSWVMHVSLPLDNGNILMGSDKHPAFQDVPFGNNIQLSLSVNTKDEADRLFQSLSGGGKVEMPMADTFWGDYFGMLSDKFGIQWMISYKKESIS